MAWPPLTRPAFSTAISSPRGKAHSTGDRRADDRHGRWPGHRSRGRHSPPRYQARAEKRTAREIAALMTGMADGLATAHAAGILHRDIKPARKSAQHGRSPR